MGTRIDVDDFGTGYSSLSYLHRMPINALKIDRGFVGPMCDDPMSRSIVQAVVALGHSLRLSVIAEGVESEKHLEAVRKIGCDYVQGYFISKALEMDDATKFIAAQSARRLAHSA
jgi:EAL domain-containing protein (putative c-di-GMP-specific phosphodiesterase class I)